MPVCLSGLPPVLLLITSQTRPRLSLTDHPHNSLTYSNKTIPFHATASLGQYNPIWSLFCTFNPSLESLSIFTPPFLSSFLPLSLSILSLNIFSSLFHSPVPLTFVYSLLLARAPPDVWLATHSKSPPSDQPALLDPTNQPPTT